MDKSTNKKAADRFVNTIDHISIWSGKAVAWLIFPMFAVLVFEVLARKFFRPTVWAIDISTMAYGTHFFIAGAYTLYKQQHIRTDFVSRFWSIRTQALLDMIQYVFLFLPGIVVLTWVSWKYAEHSWALRESMMTTWRPPAYLFKTVIPVSSFLILLQGLSEIVKAYRTFTTGVEHRNMQSSEEEQLSELSADLQQRIDIAESDKNSRRDISE